MKLKRIYRNISVLLAIIISLGSFCSLSVLSAYDYNLAILSGSGTSVDPYQISNAEELATLANTVNQEGGWFKTQGKYYILTNDIELNDVSNSDWTKNAKEWIYGTADEIEERSFKGNLNGNGYVIRGLYIKNNAKKYNGLFPGIMGGATVADIGFEDCYIDASSVDNSEVGCIAGGQHVWPVDQTLNISTSYIGSSVTLCGGISGGFVGHIVRKTVIYNCYSALKDSNSLTKGSFIGDVDKSISLEINNSYSISNVAITGVKEGGGDVTFSGSYSTKESKPGFAKVSLEKLTGKNVADKIDMLDFDGTWEAKENSTPILSIFNKNKEPIVCWDKSVATSFDGGDGTEDNPYLISSASQLAYLAQIVNGNGLSTKDKYYKLTKDIYLNDVTDSNWKANPNKWEFGIIKKDVDKAGDQTTINNMSFYGHLDGDGKIIRGIYETNTAIAASAGLFPSLGDGAEIKNLGFEDCYIKISRNVGVISGITARQTDTSKIVISNCYVSESVDLIQTSSNASYAGGFIGRIQHSVEVNDSYSSANITQSQWQRIGGIIGGAWDVSYSVEFKNCYNTQATVYGVDNRNFFIYEGNTTGSVTFSNCYTTGDVKDNETGITKVSYSQMLGSDAKISMSGLGYSEDGSFCIANGKTPQLILFRKKIPDTTPPVLSGTLQKNAASSESIEIKWQAAIDNITAKEHIEYTIYVSNCPITSDNIENAKLVGTKLCDTTFVVDGLLMGEKYYFAVQAKDTSDNTALILTDNPLETEKTVNGIWNGTIAQMFDGGDGTENNPYRISSAEQLAHLVDIVNNQPADTTKDKYYVITDDIYLNDVKKTDWQKRNPLEWTVGVSNSNVVKGFAGVLDGQNHIIYGIYINKNGGTFNGLFSSVDGTALIKNLGIRNSYISSYDWSDNVARGSMAGAFSGTVSKINFGGGETAAIFENCFTDETVYVQGVYCAGGIVGSVLHSGSNVNFNNCYSGAKLESDTFTGSIAGDAWDPTYTIKLNGCYGTQTGVSLVGHTDTIPTYTNCYSNVSSKDGVSKVFDWMMRGEDAKKNMPSFDFVNVWGVSQNATPYLLSFGNIEYGVDLPLINISFETNGGNEIEPISDYTGSKLVLPTPVKEGYVFKGWYVYKELDIEYSLDTFPGYDLTLFAKWEDIAIVRQDFESYTYIISGQDGLGEDYEFFRPGINLYDPIFVYGGNKSVHRLGVENKVSAFQIFNDNAENKLIKGKNYKIRMWVYLVSTSNPKEEISIISTDYTDVYKTSNGMLNVEKLSNLKIGKWQEIVVEFKSNGEYLAVLTPGLTDIYFDDIVIIPIENNALNTMDKEAPEFTEKDLNSTIDESDDIKDNSDSNNDISKDNFSPNENNDVKKILKKRIVTNQINKEVVTELIPAKSTKTTTTTVYPDTLWLLISIGFASSGLLISLAWIIVFIVKKRKLKNINFNNYKKGKEI